MHALMQGSDLAFGGTGNLATFRLEFSTIFPKIPNVNTLLKLDYFGFILARVMTKTVFQSMLLPSHFLLIHLNTHRVRKIGG